MNFEYGYDSGVWTLSASEFVTIYILLTTPTGKMYVWRYLFSLFMVFESVLKLIKIF